MNAETRLKPALIAAPLLLQWGRVPDNAEGSDGTHVNGNGSSASMRPRSCERGREILGENNVLNVLASMGPRSFERGKVGLDRVNQKQEAMLQWGRAPTNAER